jgi:hypothetical protein
MDGGFTPWRQAQNWFIFWLKLNMKKLIIIPVLVLGAVSLRADEFFQASLTPDIAIHAKTTEIRGLSLDIWGENPQQSLHLGFVNGSTGDSGGLSWGLVNYADSFTGAAWGVVNFSNGKFVGWQNGPVNFSQDTFVGLQSGGINVAQKMNGLQLGFVNYAEDLRGVQLGFVNVALNNPWFTEFPNQLATGFPILNWSF